jgi:methanogenic corrinoid protein MtbC1
VADGQEFRNRLLAQSLSERFGLALIEGDVSGAERIAREAFDEELPYALIHDGVIAPALQRIGVLWERGEISVAHEHLATQISLSVLALLRELFRVARSRSEHRVMLAAVQGEHHIVALQMAADLLDDAGYDAVMLGPDVPTIVLEGIVREHAPRIVAFTVTMSPVLGELPRAVRAVEAGDPTAEIIVGGNVGGRRLPNPYRVTFATSVVEVVDLADALVHRPGLN